MVLLLVSTDGARNLTIMFHGRASSFGRLLSGLAASPRPEGRMLRCISDLRAGSEWLGVGPAPPLLKQATLRGYARRFGLRILVETGTYLGDTVAALRHDFSRIYTVELDARLAGWARKRFRRYSHISVIENDSAQALPTILAGLAEPALFWLDGHYSGPGTAFAGAPTPIVRELEAILRSSPTGHVVLIDDAREFGAEPGYPTIEDIRGLIRNYRSDWGVSVQHDIIRTHAVR